MDIVGYAAKIYSGSGFGAAVCDSGLRVLWKNRPELPDRFKPPYFADPDEFCPDPSGEKLFRCENGDAARFIPVEDGGETYYIVELYSGMRIQELICSSQKIDELNAQTENARRLLTGAVSAAARSTDGETPSETRSRIYHDVSLNVIRVLSVNVNFGYLSRLMSRGINGSFMSIDTRLRQTADYLERIMSAAGTEIVCDIAPRTTGFCDYYFFEAVVLNLVTNAHLYAVCDKKRVELSLACSSDRNDYILTVSDNGTAADLEKITSGKYFELSPEGEAGEHLGLAYAKYYTEKMNGRMEFSLTPTGGLSVRLTFPRENGSAPNELCMEYMSSYSSICDPCFCILAKGADPTVYDIKPGALRIGSNER